MMSGENWWRANEISIGHLTREGEVGDRWRDKTAMLAHRPVDRDLRRNPTRLPALDEGLGVVALVGAEGRPSGKAARTASGYGIRKASF
jgi:hypothetical protein